MRFLGTLFVLCVLAVACGARAEDPPDAPSALSSSIVTARTAAVLPQMPAETFLASRPLPRKTLDRNFLLLSGLAMGLTVADFELTQNCMARRYCAEGNPLVPSSRAGMYATNIPLNAALLYWSYRRKADGKRLWWLPPLMIIGSHAAGVGTNINVRR